jgi:hypothetical protein
MASKGLEMGELCCVVRRQTGGDRPAGTDFRRAIAVSLLVLQQTSSPEPSSIQAKRNRGEPVRGRAGAVAAVEAVVSQAKPWFYALPAAARRRWCSYEVSGPLGDGKRYGGTLNWHATAPPTALL